MISKNETRSSQERARVTRAIGYQQRHSVEAQAQEQAFDESRRILRMMPEAAWRAVA